MNGDSRTLMASANGIGIGKLVEDNGVWSFEYDALWLQRPDRFALCPDLPLQPGRQTDTSTDRPVQWFFDNLLPEEEQRGLLATAARLDVDDAWSMLAYYGAESAGAITLLPPGADEPAPGRVPLSLEALNARILDLPRRPLDANAPKHMSVAGAQHKLAAILEGGPGHWTIWEPVGAEPSTHILKPDSRSETWRHTAINEFYCMRLAARAGLPVPATVFLRVPAPVFAVARFDRRSSDGRIWRRHVIDGMQIRGKSRVLKYAQSSTETLKQLIALTLQRTASRLALYRWIAFNVLIGNGDAHMKNLSFFSEPRGYALAPFYDLVSTVVYDTVTYRNNEPFWPDSELTMPIGNARHFRDIRRDDVIQAGVELGLSEGGAAAELDALLATLERAKREVFEQVVAEAQPDAGEIRILNSILFMPLAEMSRQLQR